MIKIFINAKEILKAEKNPETRICGKKMSNVSRIKNAFLIFDNEIISDFGEMKDFDNSLLNQKNIEIFDLKNE